MNNRVTGRFAVKTLEFDKVKMRAAEKAATELGKDRLLALGISSDFETVKRMHIIADHKRRPAFSVRRAV